MWIGYAHPDRLLSYPDVAYLSGCVLVAGGCSPSTRAGPRLCLLVSGVTPLRWVLRRFGGGGVLPHWGHAPSLASCSLTGVMLPDRSSTCGLVLCRVWERLCAWFSGNLACNSPVTTSKLEIAALEFQRFLALLKFESIELHATFLGD